MYLLCCIYEQSTITFGRLSLSSWCTCAFTVLECFSIPAMMAVGGRSVMDRFIRFFCFVWPLSEALKIFTAQRSHAARLLARACHAHFMLVRDGAPRCRRAARCRFAAAKPPVNNATGHGQRLHRQGSGVESLK